MTSYSLLIDIVIGMTNRNIMGENSNAFWLIEKGDWIWPQTSKSYRLWNTISNRNLTGTAEFFGSCLISCISDWYLVAALTQGQIDLERSLSACHQQICRSLKNCSICVQPKNWRNVRSNRLKKWLEICTFWKVRLLLEKKKSWPFQMQIFWSYAYQDRRLRTRIFLGEKRTVRTSELSEFSR